MGYSRFVSMVAAVCVCASVLAGQASAAEEKKSDLTGLYGGAGFGVGTAEHQSDADYAWRMNVWWRPIDYAALEIGYLNAGRPSNNDEVDGVDLLFEPMMPLPMGFDLFGKVGGFFWDHTDIMVGMGLAYHLPWKFGLRLDWDVLNAENDNSLNVVTLGLFYHFAKP